MTEESKPLASFIDLYQISVKNRREAKFLGDPKNRERVKNSIPETLRFEDRRDLALANHGLYAIGFGPDWEPGSDVSFSDACAQWEADLTTHFDAIQVPTLRTELTEAMVDQLIRYRFNRSIGRVDSVPIVSAAHPVKLTPAHEGMGVICDPKLKKTPIHDPTMIPKLQQTSRDAMVSLTTGVLTRQERIDLAIRTFDCWQIGIPPFIITKATPEEIKVWEADRDRIMDEAGIPKLREEIFEAIMARPQRMAFKPPTLVVESSISNLLQRVKLLAKNTKLKRGKRLRKD